MIICFISDLHLPYNRNAIQYRAFEYFCANAKQAGAQLFVAAGDYTANGDIDAALFFRNTLEKTGIPYLITTGNSDIRDKSTAERILGLSSPCFSCFDGIGIILLNDADARISKEAETALLKADKNAVAVMHHPPECFDSAGGNTLEKFCQTHPESPIFFAHIHKSFTHGRMHSLPCADPDKAIGEEPAVLIFDTQTKEEKKIHFPCPMPENFRENIGITCYNPIEDLDFARKNAVLNAELRYNAAHGDTQNILEAVKLWRKNGAKNLSVHAPDILFDGSSVKNCDEWKNFIDFVNILSADRITVHTPRCSVENFDNNILRNNLEKFINIHFEKLHTDCVIGVENMHMTAKDLPDRTRRFGYTPDECKTFAAFCAPLIRHRVGFNLDIGHARNNAPFSEKYTLGAWYAELGKNAVGYHIHQVRSHNGMFENHTAFTCQYGALISLASFFGEYSRKNLANVPVILEIRNNGFIPSLEALFEQNIIL